MEMEAGPALDSLIAERVMGGSKVLNYSTDMGAAWLVVEKMADRYKDVSFYIEWAGKGQTFWCRFDDASHGTWDANGNHDTRLGESYGKTAPLTICLAALKSVL